MINFNSKLLWLLIFPVLAFTTYLSDSTSNPSKKRTIRWAVQKTSSIRILGSAKQLNGKRSFSYAGFKLTPPKKFAGLIKENDKFNVDFNLLPDPV